MNTTRHSSGVYWVGEKRKSIQEYSPKITLEPNTQFITYRISYDETSQRWTNDTWNGSESIGDSHRNTGMLWRNVKMIYSEIWNLMKRSNSCFPALTILRKTTPRNRSQSDGYDDTGYCPSWAHQICCCHQENSLSQETCNFFSWFSRMLFLFNFHSCILINLRNWNIFVLVWWLSSLWLVISLPHIQRWWAKRPLPNMVQLLGIQPFPVYSPKYLW